MLYANIMFIADSVGSICIEGTSNSLHIYRQASNIRRTLVGNNIVDHSDVDAAPTSSSLST